MRYDDQVLSLAPNIFAKLDDVSAASGAADLGSRGTAGAYAGSGVTYQSPGPMVREVSKGATFNGTAGRVLFNNITGDDLPTLPFTLECWLRPTSTPAPSSDWVMNLYASDSSEYAGIGTTSGGGITIVHGNDIPQDITTAADRLTGHYQHVAAVFLNEDSRKLYVDGRLVANDTQSVAWSGDGGLSESCSLAIGYSGGGSYFPGGLSCVAYYTQGLTGAQVLANYRAGMLNGLYQGVIDKLKSSADLWAITAGRIYANVLPDPPGPPGIQVPAVRVAVLDNMAHNRMDSGLHRDATVQVDAFTQRMDEPTAWTIAAITESLLSRQSIRMAGYAPAGIVCETPGVTIQEPSFTRVMSRYRILANV